MWSGSQHFVLQWNISIDLWPKLVQQNCKIIIRHLGISACKDFLSVPAKLLSTESDNGDWAHWLKYCNRYALSVLWTGCELGDIPWEIAVLRYSLWKPNISCWCSLTLKAFNWWNTNWLLLWSSHANCNVFATCHWTINELLIKLSLPSLANSVLDHERAASSFSAR